MTNPVDGVMLMSTNFKVIGNLFKENGLIKHLTILLVDVDGPLVYIMSQSDFFHSLNRL